MRRALIAGLFLAVDAAGNNGLVAAPPPPPPPGAVDRANAILQMPRQGDLVPYVAQFANDVKLTVRAQVVARGQAELLRYLRERQRLTITVLDASYGNPIMASESVSNMPDAAVPGVVIDCCFWARVATYHLNEVGRVDRVEFIENDAYWGRPERPR